jgi:hypothetical protein
MEGILKSVQGEARKPLDPLALKRSVRSLHCGWILVNWRGKDQSDGRCWHPSGRSPNTDDPQSCPHRS